MSGPHVVLNPAQAIVFDRPGENFVTVELKIKNIADKCVHFKVKTTAPKRYCVRPNGGLVNAGETTTVLIILQKVAPNVALTNPKKDKFLVQTCIAAASEDPKSLWNNLPQEQLSEHKLRCVWNVDDKNKEEEEPIVNGSGIVDAQDKPVSTGTLAASTKGKEISAATPKVDEEALAAAQHIQTFKEENARLTKINNTLRKDLDLLKRGSTNAAIASDHISGTKRPSGAKKDGTSQYILAAAAIGGWVLGHYLI
ncbi:hypothetical protein, variant [Sphaeroforma arctica JP610]|uniref:MSP domain-containing protein n=1 Tax=Sphaeroforma arctica JP610 TaxID=667725 RepID=A0A0L0FGD6_9EUKA|nr:hypothetical protein, variant [Sphaeroforma arctica JP610]KNC75521.1 hypothetical protein, variant [Sphaeroforma arctica JP610]|eukprot:XP_014149423.1 hypothetical protein, variant [Sphaeroforma arctica JP610]